MNKLRLAVLAFCLVVIIACGWAMSGVIKALQLIKPALAEVAAQYDDVQAEEKALSEIWLSLDSKQRSERSGYDGPEAIDASYETQVALDALNQAKTITVLVEEKHDMLKTEQRATASWITPLIVIGLIHIIVFVGLLPKRRILGRQ